MLLAPPESFDPIAFHARFRGDQLACADVHTKARYTYAQLDKAVSNHARAMSRTADLQGRPVAIIARNSCQQAIIAMATERAGGICAPLNWRLTASELGALLADLDPALIIVEDEFAKTIRAAAKAAKTDAPTLSPAELAQTRTRGRYKPTPQNISAPGLILYTSGTTGRPKGVIITRNNLLYSSLNFAAVTGLNTNSVLLCDAPMFHTVGMVAITRTAFLVGATVHYSPQFAPPKTVQALDANSLAVSHYFVVPQMIEALLREPGFSTCDLSNLTAMFSGGGPLSPDLVQSCAERDVVLVNAYGMSEIGTAIHPPPTKKQKPPLIGSVGFPAPYIDCKIFTPEGKVARAGEVGEIWARGPSVSPGYWNQPEATADSFTGDWFRTGDLARQTADGAFFIEGRLKDMYISGGENVFPAQVEAVLKAVSGVSDAAVIGVPNKKWGEVGAAYIECAKNTEKLRRSIRNACADQLARYKQPAHFHYLPELPKTGSGKVLKAVLRDQFLSTEPVD